MKMMIWPLKQSVLEGNAMEMKTKMTLSPHRLLLEEVTFRTMKRLLLKPLPEQQFPMHKTRTKSLNQPKLLVTMSWRESLYMIPTMKIKE